MTYSIAKPSKLLSRYIHCYWAMENCIPAHSEHIQRIIPTGLPEITFYSDNHPNSMNQQKPINDKAILSGQLKDYYDLQLTGKLSLFAILFKPQGLSKFTNIPVNEFYDQNIPLRFVFPDAFNRLEDLLFRQDSFAGKVTFVENFLFSQLQKNKTNSNFDRIENCVDIINLKKGLVGINELASTACLSRKQFERAFSHHIGASPKQFLRIVRFQNTLNEKSTHTNLSLTELTYKCGYYDQSHMINDFLKLSGQSPKKYFEECAPFSDYFQ